MSVSGIHVSEVRFSEATEQDEQAGLLGFVACTVNGLLRLDGIALRRTRAGDLVLSFPARRDRLGADHPIVRPLGNEVRRSVQDQVLLALRAKGELP